MTIWGYELSTTLVLTMWTFVTLVGLMLYMSLHRKVFLLFSPVVAIVSCVAMIWRHTESNEPLYIGLFFLLNLGLIHLLLAMMIERGATVRMTKVAGSISMLLTGWAYFSSNPWIFAALWGLSVVPQYLSFKPGPARSIYVFHHALSFICLLLGFILLGTEQWSLANPTAVASPDHATLGIVLLVLAAFIRQGVFPFHLWFKASYKTKPFPLNIGFYLGNLGFFLFMKALLPLMQQHCLDLFPVVMTWCILSGLYFANIALVQSRLRSTIFCVMLAQFSTLFCGLEAQSLTGRAGVLFQFLALGLSFSGLIACLYLMEWYLGELRMKRFYGLQENNPTLSVFFLLFGLCAVSLPLSMGFAGEDLIFHGVIEKYPYIGLGLILTAAVNGFSLFRAMTFLFRGQRSKTMSDKIELGFWQKVALGTLLVVLFGFGFMPNLLLKHVLAFVA